MSNAQKAVMYAGAFLHLILLLRYCREQESYNMDDEIEERSKQERLIGQLKLVNDNFIFIQCIKMQIVFRMSMHRIVFSSCSAYINLLLQLKRDFSMFSLTLVLFNTMFLFIFVCNQGSRSARQNSNHAAAL